MADFVAGRSSILQSLREELVGPSPQGEEIDCNQPISFDDAKQSYGPWRQKGSGEEILMRDPPCKRYGVGVLYPVRTLTEEITQDRTVEVFIKPTSPQANSFSLEDIVTDQAQQSIDRIEKRAEVSAGDLDTNDFDLSPANTFKPSSMGISFLAVFPKNAVLIVEVLGGRYRKHIVRVEKQERIWWLRSPVSIQAEYDTASVCTLDEAQVKARFITQEKLEGLDIKVELFSRPYQNNQKRLLTICLVNRSKAKSQVDQYCLFQAFFKVSIISPGSKRLIYPYPGATDEAIKSTTQSNVLWDEEEQSLALLYRRAKTFAVGHGCAANWESIEGTWQDQLTDGNHKIGTSTLRSRYVHDKKLLGNPGEAHFIMELFRPSCTSIVSEVENVGWVSAENLPSIEVPSITPDVKRKDGTTVEVAMASLAGLISGKDGFDALSEVVTLYEDWLGRRTQEISSLDPKETH